MNQVEMINPSQYIFLNDFHLYILDNWKYLKLIFAFPIISVQ